MIKTWHFAVILMLLAGGCSEKDSTSEKLNQAVTHARNGNWELAAKNADSVAEEHPGTTAPMLLQALAYEKQGDLIKAVDLARQCVHAAPDDFTSLYTLGRLYSLDQKRQGDAFATLEKALLKKPEDTNTLILLCNLGIMRQEPNTDKYLNLLKQKPEFSTSRQLYFLLGMRQAEKRNFTAAKRFMMDALNKCGGVKDPDFIYEIACCFDRCRFPINETRKFYQLYIKSRGSKNPEKLLAARKRLRQL